MECKRLMIPVLTLFIVIVYILYSLKRGVTIPTEETKTKITSSSFEKTILLNGEKQRSPKYFHSGSSSSKVDTNSPPHFDFIHSSEENCLNSKPYILLLITSGLKNRQRRDTIRYTWGQITRGKEWPNKGPIKDVRLLFLLGECQNASLNSEVRMEALTYNDMMIGGFNDSYRNLTYKTLMGLKWMKIYCPEAQYVLKTDDDMFLDIPNIINRLKVIQPKNTIIGYFAGIEEPDRDNKSKSYVSEDEYPKKWYPNHVKGCMYIIPRILALNILNASQRFNFLSMEDVFITGVLAEPFHVNYSGIPVELYDKNVGDGTKIDACDFIRERKLIAHNINEFTALFLWNRIENPEICTKDNRFYRF